MKRRKSKEKRSYWSFFTRIFAGFLAAAAVLGSIAVAFWRSYKIRSLQASDSLTLAGLSNWLNNAVDPSEEEIRRELAVAANGADYWLDRGYVLYDRVTNRTYDSSKLVWAHVMIGSQSLKLMDELNEKARELVSQKQNNANILYETNLPDGSFSKYFINDDPELLEKVLPTEKPYTYINLHVDEIYVQGERFKLGKFDVLTSVTTGAPSEKTNGAASYDLTDEIGGGYLRFVDVFTYVHEHPEDALGMDILTVSPMGSRTDSPALQEAYRYKDWWNSDEGNESIYEVKTPFGYTATNIYMQKFPSGENTRWELYTATYYSFFQMFLPRFLRYSTFLFVILLILSALIAKIRHMRYCKEYEMNEYRRGLTAALAHDLKSPLTAISGYAENLRENVHTEKRGDYADAILENAQYMDNIIADVLELAKLEQKTKIKTAPADLMQLARDAAARHAANTADKEITVQLSGKCEIAANKKMMAQAIGNLIDNAVRYTPQGGCIDITGTEHGLRIRNDTDAANFDDVQALCEPFAKGDAARGTRAGSGMGLAIVRQICKLHGFRLCISAKEGKFTAEIRF